MPSKHPRTMTAARALCEGYIMDKIIQKLAKVEKAPGDYTGEDGLLYCGKCRTPKQKRQSFPTENGGTMEIAVGIACKCQREADEEKRAQDELEQFKLRMSASREDGISCPSGLRYHFAEDDLQQPKVSGACRQYVERWEEMRAENIGLLFYGNVGAGKTFLASCIGNALMDKMVPVVSTNFPRLLNLLQGTQEKQRLLDRLSVYKLLIIDDLGVERDSTFAAEQVFNVIDARASSKLPLIVTTNLTLEELEHPASMQYARIYDRVLEMCPVRFKMTGQSRRIENAERRKETARKLLLES